MLCVKRLLMELPVLCSPRLVVLAEVSPDGLRTTASTQLEASKEAVWC